MEISTPIIGEAKPVTSIIAGQNPRQDFLNKLLKVLENLKVFVKNNHVSSFDKVTLNRSIQFLEPKLNEWKNGGIDKLSEGIFQAYKQKFETSFNRDYVIAKKELSLRGARTESTDPAVSRVRETLKSLIMDKSKQTK